MPSTMVNLTFPGSLPFRWNGIRSARRREFPSDSSLGMSLRASPARTTERFGSNAEAKRFLRPYGTRPPWRWPSDESWVSVRPSGLQSGIPWPTGLATSSIHSTEAKGLFRVIASSQATSCCTRCSVSRSIAHTGRACESRSGIIKGNGNPDLRKSSAPPRIFRRCCTKRGGWD